MQQFGSRRTDSNSFRPNHRPTTARYKVARPPLERLDGRVGEWGTVNDNPPQWRAFADSAIELALEQAQLAPDYGDVPVGAVIFDSRTGAVIAAAHNRREADSDPVAHAELLALQQAATLTGQWRLSGFSLAVTLEPCLMCAGAAVNSRIDAVAFGAFDLKAGAMGSLYHVGADPRLNHEIETHGGLQADRCAALLVDFFAAKRDR